ncbi:hypothetical protein GCM10007052_34920 [Halioglobus japonicus]|uniref:sulfatase-like hydrolase/transferase n=1 Tax=Halioglobus japonicus TaxID=930805 RepID=UPI0015E0F18A|nr:sulfatase-like hydrolase/transferase [Halioglobus japonicus]GHD22871.1 hypothetical protein GCM10007052_34920 [Halioglobus japonicus]
MAALSRLFLLLLVLLFIAGCDRQEPASPAAPDKPNILFILVDDMGYADLGANRPDAGVSLTPALDQLANEGIRYTRNYVDSTCAASRAGILTGTSPLRRGFRPQGTGIAPEVDTLPELLREAGYSTHHVGKWHLGYVSQAAWPLAQGFDTFYGFLTQFFLRGPHEPPELKVARPVYSNPWLQRDNKFPRAHQGHLSQLLLDEVLTFVASAPQRDEPWFLNYWLYLPHGPLQPAADFADQFADTPGGRYQAMLAQLDHNIGRVLEKLDDVGLAESTLVIVTSDNGGTAKQIDSNAPFSGTKMSFEEGGVRTPLIVRWPDGLGGGTTDDTVVSYLDYLPTMAIAAGSGLPAGLPGRDLRALAQGEALSARSLFWDSGTSSQPAWSMLSADGRWRVHRNFLGDPVLNDLQTDSAGSENFAAERPDILARNIDSFQQWRMAARTLDLLFESHGAAGRGVLRGEDFQRTPGVGGFSFAVAVTPTDTNSSDVQIIAEQPRHWRFWQQGEKLYLDVVGLTLESAAPPSGRCTPLVVTAAFNFSHIAPSKAYAVLELFIGDERVASTRISRPSPPVDSYSAPTYLGANAQGKASFGGILGQPVIVNEMVVPDDVADPWTRNGVSDLTRGLCDEVNQVLLEPGQ